MQLMNKLRYKFFTWRVTAILIILLGFSLRISDLSVHPIWFDEAVEYWLATTPLSSLPTAVSTIIEDPPLYSVFLHFWIQGGQNEFWLRYMSVLFSVVGMLGIMILGKLSFGNGTGLIAGLLVAVSPPHIRYAQEVGQYALMICALSWSLVFLYLALTRNLWRWWILWGVLSVVAVYSYYGAAVIIGITGTVAVLYIIARKNGDALLKQMVTGVTSGFFVLILVVRWYPARTFWGPTGNQALEYMVRSPKIEFARFFIKFKDLAVYQLMGYQETGWPWPIVPESIVLIPVLVAVAFGLLRLRSNFYTPIFFIVCYLGYYLFSRVGYYPPMGGNRWSLILFPLLLIIIAAGIINIGRYNFVPGAVVLGIILSVGLFAPPESQEDLRTITQFWRANRKMDVVTYVYSGAAPAFRYQLNLLEGTSPNVPSTWFKDCSSTNDVVYCSQDGIFYGRETLLLAPDQKINSVLQTVGSTPKQMWIIFSHVIDNEDEDILASFDQTYRIILSNEATGASAYLLEER